VIFASIFCNIDREINHIWHKEWVRLLVFDVISLEQVE